MLNFLNPKYYNFSTNTQQPIKCFTRFTSFKETSKKLNIEPKVQSQANKPKGLKVAKEVLMSIGSMIARLDGR